MIEGLVGSLSPKGSGSNVGGLVGSLVGGSVGGLVGLVGGLVGLVGGLLGGLAGGARSNVGGLLGGLLSLGGFGGLLLSLGGLDSARGVGGAISGSAPSIMAERRRAPRPGGPTSSEQPDGLPAKLTAELSPEFSTLDAKTSLLSEKGGLGRGGGIGGTAVV